MSRSKAGRRRAAMDQVIEATARFYGVDLERWRLVSGRETPPFQIHVNDGSAHARMLAWNRAHDRAFERSRRNHVRRRRHGRPRGRR